MRPVSPETRIAIRSVASSETNLFTRLVSIAGLTPSRDFSDVVLKDANFYGSDLAGYNFSGTKFVKCFFHGARIRGASFDRAVFDRTNIWAAEDWKDWGEEAVVGATLLAIPLRQTDDGLEARLADNLVVVVPSTSIVQSHDSGRTIEIAAAFISKLRVPHTLAGRERPTMDDWATGNRLPFRLGRLLLALRETVGMRGTAPEADPIFRRLYAVSKPERLSRSMAAAWVREVAGIVISEKQIQRVETGERRSHKEAQLRGLLRSYGLSAEEVEAVVEDPELNRTGGNPHLIADWRLRGLAVYEFGPLINEAFRIGDRCSTWLEVEKAASGGYRPDEIKLLVATDEIDPPPAFRKIADEVSRQNVLKKERGIRGWTDNPTLCLASVVDHLAAGEEERRSITCRFVPSKYRFNVVAKQAAGAGFRARALQDASWPLKPVPFLSSGVGICINVICDDGKTLVVGRRGDDETFRKGEYDIAVVEGIRPTSNVIDGRIDIVGVAKRALIEELGLHIVAPDEDIDQIIEELRIFELGCDLEYYQWNFLAYAKVKLNFDQIYSGWQKAKDRKENRTITRIDFTRDAVLDFVTNQHIWSSGAACALRTFDYYT